MSYTRVFESGYYIYPTKNSVFFDGIKISNDVLNVFLYKLYKYHKAEFKERIKDGKVIINKNKQFLNDINKKEDILNLDEDELLKSLYNNGKELSKYFGVHTDDIKRAIKEINTSEDDM